MSGRFARGARIALATGAGIALLIALAAWALVRSGTFDAWLTDRVAALLGPRVNVLAARALWWPRPGVALDDVALVSPAGAAGDTVAAAAVICRLRLDALLTGDVELATVRIDGVRATVERGSDGRVRVAGVDLLALANAGSGSRRRPQHVPAVRLRDATLVYRSEGPDAPPPLQLQVVEAGFSPAGRGGQIELAARLEGEGTVRMRGEVAALDALESTSFTAKIDADQIDPAALRGWLPPTMQELSAGGRLRLAATVSGHGTATIDGEARLELADGLLAWDRWQATAPVLLTAHASWNGSAVTLSQGRLVAARIGNDTVAAHTFTAGFSYADGALRIETAELQAYGGTWRSSGSVQLSDPPVIDGTVNADGVDGAQLVDALHAAGVVDPLPQVAAPLQFSATVAGSPGKSWNATAQVETSGPAAWSRARLDGPIQVAAELQAAPGSPDGPLTIALENGHAQIGRVTVDQLAIDAVSADFTYRNGVARVAPLAASAFGGTWSYQGTLPLGDAARWNGQLSANAVSVGALQAAVAMDDTTGLADGTVNLTAQLAGTGTATMTGRASAQLASQSLTWTTLRVDRPADVAASLRLQGTRPTLTDGQVRAQGVRVGEVSMSNISGRFSYADANLRLASVQARGFGGAWQADGTLALAPTPTWSGNVAATRVDFDALLDPLPGDGPHSRDGVADLTLRLHADADGTTTGTTDIRLASGSFIWDALRVDGPAHAQGTFAVRNGNLTLSSAAAEAAHAAYGPLIAAAATAHFQFAKDRLSFTDLQFRSCDGAWTHSGWYDLDPGGHFAGQLAIRGAEPREVLAMLGNTESDFDFTSADLDSQFTGRATPEWLDDLRATGSLVMRGGTMQSAAVLRAIWEALFGSGRVTDAMNRIDRRTRVQEISGSFVLRDQQINTTDLTVASDDYNVTALGDIGLDGQLDLQARIRLTSQGVQKMIILGSLPLPTEILPDLPAIPTSVSGSLTNPVIRPNVSALPATTVRWMVDVLLHSPRSIGGAVVNRLGQLWDGTKSAAGAVGNVFRRSE